MIINHNKEGYVDFEAPIYMDDKQRNKFIIGVRKIFGKDAEVRDVIESKKEMGDISRTMKRFSKHDFLLLSNPKYSNEELARKMKKTSFAIQMRRGSWLMELQDWATKKGKTKISAKDVEEYLEGIGLK